MSVRDVVAAATRDLVHGSPWEVSDELARR